MATKSEPSTSNGRSPNGWQLQRFDTFAQNVAQRVDPSETDAEVYVGLEHLDSESLKIRRWGTPSDVIGQKLVFQKGDIIFGRRRAYQRKMGVADCDGICSAHAMVIRAKSDAIEPAFLPFLIQSDLFMSRAVSISVGSLSPTINWKTMRVQEFPVPSRDKQKEAAIQLSQADQSIDDWIEVCNRIEQLTRVTRFQVFGTHAWDEYPLGDLFDVKLGKMLSPKAKRGLNPRPYLANYNVQWGRLDLDDVQTMDFDDNEFERFKLKKCDLLVCEGGEVGRSAIWNDEISDCCYQKAIHRLRPCDDRMLPEFMLQFFFWADRKGKFAGLTGHSTIAHLTAVKLRTLKVAVPPKGVQQTYVRVFRELDQTLQTALRHIESIRKLKTSLVTQLFSETDV